MNLIDVCKFNALDLG